MIYAIGMLIGFSVGLFAGYSYFRTKLQILDRQVDDLKLEVRNWKFLHGAVQKENLRKGKRLYKAELLIQELKEKRKP